MRRTGVKFWGFVAATLSGAGVATLVGAGAAPPAPKLIAPATKAVTTEQTEFFETKVRPLLFARCFGCHGDKQQISGLRLDGLAHVLKGGSRGPALVPGDAEKSLLTQTVRYDTPLKMPPTGKLKDDEIATLTAWVKMGAPWPGASLSDAARQAALRGDYVITDAQRNFWAFRPVRKPALPVVKNALWAKSPVDRFILSRLEAKKLTPAPPADKRTLLRRVTFDLIGLPPTPDEVDAFARDKFPNAFAKVVDRLLASPRYGERWGRYWLDVARYADTKGYSFAEDAVYHNAYTYRDYVIRAFNEDLPYNRFILEQLAADQLPASGGDKRALAALGFLTVGRRYLNDPVFINDDRIDVTCRGLMGLTVACARCHNHKFDPIPTNDYYALYGVFASSVEPAPSPAISPPDVVARYEAQRKQIEDAMKQRGEVVKAQLVVLPARLAKLADAKDAKAEAAKKILAQVPKEGPNDGQIKALRPYFDPSAASKIKTLEATLVSLHKTMPPSPDYAMAMTDAPKPVEPHVFIRGNAQNQGDAVPRRFLQILSGPDRKPFAQGSGRLELAQAIASPANPLTARVLVNRVWQHHFGKALVRTPSDYGVRGEPPTHPELLDYLAARFVEGGWSIKKLHRLILLSSVYQQASDASPRALKIDPENRLLSHENRQRLDLESLRDSLLFVAGQLDTTLGGPAVEITRPPYPPRRTVYGFVDRQNLQSLFRAFDFASPDSSSAQRFQTTVPQQALFLMNSPFVLQQAHQAAQRKELLAVAEDRPRIVKIYRLLFGRAPTPDEIAVGLSYLHEASAADRLALARTAATPLAAPKNNATPNPPSAQNPTPTAWDRYAQALLLTNEFVFVD